MVSQESDDTGVHVHVLPVDTENVLVVATVPSDLEAGVTEYVQAGGAGGGGAGRGGLPGNVNVFDGALGPVPPNPNATTRAS